MSMNDGCRRWFRTSLLFWVNLFLIPSLLAQSGQWTTYSHDPQRSGWAPEETAFSPSKLSQLGLLWKTVVPNAPSSMNGLTAPLVVRGVATPSRQRNLVIVAGSSDHVFGLDAESGELVWRAEVAGEEKPPGPSSWLCPFALNATPVIDPDRARMFVVASDGRLHTLSLSEGRAVIPPTHFVPAFSKMWSLNYSGGVLYTSISQDCNNVRSGIAAVNPDAPGRPVVRFNSAGSCSSSFCGAGIWGRGGPSADFDGYIYGAAGDAPFDPDANAFGDTVLKLAPRTLQVAGYYTPKIWEYLTKKDLDMGTSTPVIFRWRNHVLAAVGGKEGAIYVLDTSYMSGPDHSVAAYISPRYTNREQTFEKNGIWGVISVWKDPAGDTWLYVPSWGPPTDAARFPLAHGPVRMGSIMAFKVVAGDDGGPALEPAWISHDIAVPDPAAIVGGMVFVLGTGEDPSQVRNGDINQILTGRERLNRGHAILYALDARTGRELWSSGNAISGWTHFSGLAVGDGKIFATTHDGAVYAFGLRKPGDPVARVRVIPGLPAAAHPANIDSAAVEPTPSTTPNLPQCGEAAQVFRRNCSICHGSDGRGDPSRHTPNFTDTAWQQARTDSQLLDAVKNGTQHGMPGFGDQLAADQIDRLVHCMIRGFSQSPAKASGTSR